MDPLTQKYYSTRVKDAAELYQTCTDGGIQKYFSQAFKPQSRIFEIGAGTGRDLKALRALGHDAFGIDASPEMVQHACSIMPELQNRCIHETVPSEKIFFDEPFDGILCSAVMMHVPDEQILDTVYTIKRNLKPGGRLLLSVPLKRDDLDEEGRTPDGRLFHMRQPGYYSLVLERLGFKQLMVAEEGDSLGRSGISWSVMIFSLASDSVRSLDRIESVLNRDKKTATYKLALFRALADIALTEYNNVTWYPDNRVGVPIDSIVEKWIIYYWPLFTDANFIPQINGEEPGCKMPVKFRKSLADVADEYGGAAGCANFLMICNEGSLKDTGAKNLFRDISETIKKGPVVYSGGASGDSIFSYDTNFKNVTMDSEIWKELCLMGHWIREALVLRWAELTSHMSGGKLLPSQVIDLLLRQPESERDTSRTRKLFERSASLECVWSGRNLQGTFDIDHVIPYSLWFNNDTWNLLPADPKVNNQKRDKLPAKSLLEKRREVIIGYWKLIRKETPERFMRETGRFTGRPLKENWENMLFSTMVTAVEFTANQRGIQRWEV